MGALGGDEKTSVPLNGRLELVEDCGLVVATSNDDEWIECIDCGYSENRPTHVDEPQIPAIPDEVGVIQFKPRQSKE